MDEPATDRLLNFDQFGKRAQFFGLDVGTTFEGRVTVRTLADGRAHVSVLLHTRNAVCWGFQGDFKGQYPPAFGYTPREVFSGLETSLGDGMMNIEFTLSSPDDPLPNFFSVPLESVTVVINCSGELRNGSGFPDGTPGRAHTTHVFFAGTEGPGGCRGGSDCIATEKIDWNPARK
jgi:hypothetical protein